MRASEDQIKAAILHPEEEVRLEAVGYWADCHGSDETIMPLVIQAVERYGRDCAFGIIRDSERLVQTPATVEWLIGELRRKFDLQDIAQDNYRFAVALALVAADPELLIPIRKEIAPLPAFPEQLRQTLDNRLRFHLMEWQALWAELEQFGYKTMEQEGITLADCHYARWLIESMGRHVREGDKVIRALDQEVAKSKRDLMAWLVGDLVELAGRMRLRGAVPRIMRKMRDGHDAVLDASSKALGRIGTNVVVEAIAHDWKRFAIDGRLVFCEAMAAIHTDRCIDRLVEFLFREEDPEVTLFLADALLSHACTQGVATACHLGTAHKKRETPDERDLRFRAVAVATIMEMDFPGYEQWHKEAVATNYGWGNHRTDRTQRMSEHFRTE